MDDEYEIMASFNHGKCTCEHEPEEHGWINCDVEGCDCDANWEE